ncbi:MULTISPECIES: hypothetical protein [Gordonia]|uniref:hypothetical protein n=1 Tax=Gordonia TaxID=2053 RepID=UPI001331B54E|nr:MULTISPECIES: hypothetical protein [Gordonia]KAF0968951.1 hypothetical protein BPODLACK_02608 [Gordonia sp. YY1]MCZ0911137.1 hypothetical protein [Gordonia amicalis]UPW12775.1 hypothetical protein M0655_15675 [Gordonia amicalis]
MILHDSLRSRIENAGYPWAKFPFMSSKVAVHGRTIIQNVRVFDRPSEGLINGTDPLTEGDAERIFKNL